jgi:ABC-2 type transport system ATP-binding protein
MKYHADLKSEEIAVKVDNVTKAFRLPHERANSVKSVILNVLHPRRSFERQQALANVDFDIKKGEFFGIVGRNGSGKSTLLKLLAGIYLPDTGSVTVHGQLTPFIELGVGFNPELTGRENVFLNGALLGFNRKEMLELYDDIVEFAELERFMDQKLKNYSSGMQVRLAFSIAIRADSDILLIDEVLAVGDASFQKKCYDYFKELKRRKKTVVFVSHDATVLEEYCDRGILINGGKLLKRGPIQRVVRDYNELLNEQEEKSEQESQSDEGKARWGSGSIEVTAARMVNPESHKEQRVFTDEDHFVGIAVDYESHATIEKPVYGITITDATGERIFQSNTLWSKTVTTDMPDKQHVTVNWKVPNIFNTGTFKVAPAVADRRGNEIFDWREDLATFKVRKLLLTTAHANVAHTITVAAQKSSSKKG